jgi:hypothetical protein
MDEPVPTTRLRDRGRLPGAAAALVVGLVLVAIVKPWGSPDVPSSPALPAQVADASPATRTPRPSPDDRAELREHCFDPIGWRVFAREEGDRRTTRSWKSVDPVPTARGPRDARIPSVLVAAERIPALGYCAPARHGTSPPITATLAIWRLEPDGTRVTRLRTRRFLPSRETILGGLYAAGPSSTDTWTSGRYVFAVRSEGYERWWAVDVVADIPAAGGS